MKKLLLFFILCMLFFSCDNGMTYKVTNLSGVDWYKTEIWFASSSVAGSGLDGSQYVGTVLIGNSASFTTKSSYFYIYAKDKNGDMVMSQTQPISINNFVTRNDLY